MIKAAFRADLSELPAAMDFIEESLGKMRIASRGIREAVLISEESIVNLIEHAREGTEVRITVRAHMGLADVSISAHGSEISENYGDIGIDLSDGNMDADAESAVRGMLLHAYGDKIRYIRKSELNIFRITAGMQGRAYAEKTLRLLLIATVLGLVLSFALPEDYKISLETYLLDPIETVFINALKLVGAPVIFFSVMTSFARYSSLPSSARISIKTILSYLATSVLAVLLGVAVFSICTPGRLGELAYFAGQTEIVQADNNMTILNMLVNIVPSSVIDPFLNGDMLQLIFLAFLFGLALGRAGGYSVALRSASDAMETLCTKVMEFISGCVPYAVFFVTISLFLKTSYKTLFTIAEFLGTLLLGSLGMVLLYSLIVLIFGRVSPIRMMKKYLPVLWSTFTSGSGAQSMAKTTRCCKNQLGISPKVYSFSIPFGAVANMDGNCVYMTVAGMFLARVCGVDTLNGGVVPLILTVVMLSVGAPMAPGTVPLCMSVLLSQYGISVNAVCIILGINAVIEMAESALNTLGDVAITVAVARSEKLLDVGVFNSRKK